MRGRWMWAPLVAVLVFTSSPPAAASGDARERAEALARDGLALAREGRFEAAIVKFDEANRLYPHPEIQHNLGRAYEELGDLKAAHRWFGQALRQDYAYAQDGLERWTRVDGELRRTHAWLTVRATPSDTQVRLTLANGAEEVHLSTPFQTWVPVGTLQILGNSPQFEPWRTTLTLKAGEDRELTMTLKPLPRQGFVQVITNVPGANVFLSEVLIGTTPFEPATHPAGVYELKVTHRGHQTHREEIAIRQDELTTVTVQLAPRDGDVADDPVVAGRSSGPPGWLVGTFVGLGSAALVTGVVLHVRAHQINSEANRIPISVPPIPADEDEYDALFGRAKSHQDWAFVSYGAAVLFIGTGAVLWAMSGDGDPASDDEDAGVTITPHIGVSPGYVGAGAAFKF